MTHFMQRHNINADLERIIYSIGYIIRGIGTTFAYLNQIGKLKNETERIAKVMLELDKLGALNEN